MYYLSNCVTMHVQINLNCSFINLWRKLASYEFTHILLLCLMFSSCSRYFDKNFLTKIFGKFKSKFSEKHDPYKNVQKIHRQVEFICADYTWTHFWHYTLGYQHKVWQTFLSFPKSDFLGRPLFVKLMLHKVIL